MSIARLLAPVVLAAMGCSGVEENFSRDVSQEVTPVQYSLDEILSVHSQLVVPLYASSDPQLVQERFADHQEEIFAVLTEYLSGVTDDALSSVQRDQRKPLSLVYNDFGAVLMLQEKPELAVLAYRTAIRLDSRNPAVLFDYATAMYELGCLHEALFYFEKCWLLDHRSDAQRFARRIEQELHLP